jgi:uncharacterized protein YggE
MDTLLDVCVGGISGALMGLMHQLISSPVRLFAPTLIVLALVAGPASAQDEGPPASTVRVTGEASVTSRPDRAELDLGVVNRAVSSQQAAAENARVAQNVLIAVRKVIGPKATIETVSYSLQPDYQYPQGGGAPKITGYTATNIIRATEDDLSLVGTVIDTATRAGANRIERIRFTLKDESAAKANALRAAAIDARAKANSLVGALGLQLVRVRSINEVGSTPRPLFDLEFRAAAATTPIQPGTIETTATVTLVCEFGRR